MGKLVVSKVSGVLFDVSFFDFGAECELLGLDVLLNIGNILVYLVLSLVIGNYIESCRLE